MNRRQLLAGAVGLPIIPAVAAAPVAQQEMPATAAVASEMGHAMFDPVTSSVYPSYGAMTPNGSRTIRVLRFEHVGEPDGFGWDSPVVEESDD